MKYMGLNDIREKFLSFFESKEHLRRASASLVPEGDKSLLLINSGMAPLKPFFTGAVTPPSKRMATCQKCIRTPDIERVGKTARHGTYFEMLGNFSFGDYFKKEATAWGWEFCTKVMEIPVDRLWVSIYEDDDEAFEIWTKDVGVAPDRIVRLGKADNFWEHGAGPCGPCSEIYFDMGVERGCGSADCAVGCDCDRFIEFWNLVFTQFDGDGKGNYARLASPNIDTGMGLERMAVIMQGVSNLFEVDTVVKITEKVTELLGVQYGESAARDISLRVITDHIRSTTMMVSDGIIPSNEGRGYILRRLLRRAARHGKLLGCDKPFLYKICDTVVAVSGEAYPNLLEKKDFIQKIIKIEEERFIETIDQGLEILNGLMKNHKAGDMLSGDDAFKLYDTFGFPVDLTKEILEEAQMTIDEARFTELMQEQRSRARAARAKAGDQGWSDMALAKLPKGLICTFLGYEQSELSSKVVALVKDDDVTNSLQEGDTGLVLTEETPFYPEGGGQAADVGTMTGAHCKLRVTGVRKTADGKILHSVEVQEGLLESGEILTLSINARRRKSIERNHTATHLLYSALRKVLGNHVTQAGSQVNQERLRFDFTHFEAVTVEELKKIEGLVNEAILSGHVMTKTEMSMKEAEALGAVANFDEKYGDVVRVVNIVGETVDLCGGCHLNNTTEVGLFKIISEGGISAGVRRMEAVTGRGLLELLQLKDQVLDMTAAVLRTKPTELLARAKSMAEEFQTVQQDVSKLRQRLAGMMAQDIMTSRKQVGDVVVITAILPDLSMEELKSVADMGKDKFEVVCAVLASEKDGKISFFGTASKAATDRGVHMGNVIKEVAKVAGGNGGGKAESAQAGGILREKMDDALAMVDDLVKQQITK